MVSPNVVAPITGEKGKIGDLSISRYITQSVEDRHTVAKPTER